MIVTKAEKSAFSPKTFQRKNTKILTLNGEQENYMSKN